MLRYVAALAAGLLLSIALADGLNPARDGNLALVDSTCLLVTVSAKDSSLTNTKTAIENEIQDKALLYSVPVRNDCSAKEGITFPTVYIRFLVLDSGLALDAQLQVIIPHALAGYTYPSVWSSGEVGRIPSGVTPQDLKDQAASLFDDFALAWKKQHAQ